VLSNSQTVKAIFFPLKQALEKMLCIYRATGGAAKSPKSQS
jgi:hypothetical protein